MQAAGGRATPEDSIPFTEEDQNTQDPSHDETTASREARKAAREREREAAKAKRAAEAVAAAAPAAAPKRPINWGKTAAIGLFVVLVGGLGLVHVMPLSSSDYSKALSEAIGQPVKIGSVNLSLYSGVELKMDNVQIGDGAKIARVRASPEVGSLFGEKKVFTQIQLDGAVIPQAMLGELLFGSMKGDGVRIGKLSFADLKVDGSLGLPKLTGELSFADAGENQVDHAERQRRNGHHRADPACGRVG